METKVFHLSSSGVKEQGVDTCCTSTTFGQCDYCHVITNYNYDTQTINPVDTRTPEDILDELGIETE